MICIFTLFSNAWPVVFVMNKIKLRFHYMYVVSISSRLDHFLGIHSVWVVLGWAYRGLTGGFLLLQNFCVAISVSPHVCFILVLILISMFLR